MSTFEELQAMCAEFSTNFVNLTQRHEELQREYEQETARRIGLEKELSTAKEDIKRLSGDARSSLGSEMLSKMEQYREKYCAACVAIEHLKGRLETTKNVFNEREEEHAAECAQLRMQMNDLLQRLEVNADSAVIAEQQKRIMELTERGNALSEQLAEERRKANEHNATCTATLEKAHSHLAIAERRCREADDEAAQQRAAALRETAARVELQAERDRLMSENRRLEASMDAHVRELALARDSVQSQATSVIEQVTSVRRGYEEELSRVRAEVRTQVSELERRREALCSEEEKVARWRDDAQRRLAVEREKALREVEDAFQARSAAQANAERFKHKLSQQEELYNALVARADAAENQVAALKNEKSELEGRIEVITQRELWISAEKTQLEAALTRTSHLAEQCAAAEQAREELELSLARMRVHLENTENDRAHWHRRAKESADHLKEVMVAHKDKVRSLTKKARKQREICEEVAEEALATRRLRHANVFLANRKKGQLKYDIFTQNRPEEGVDILEVLRNQSKAGVAIQEKLAKLSGINSIE